MKLNEPFSYESWFRALKAGRSFGTNGPMLFLRINGEEVGSILRFHEGKPARLRIQVEATSQRKLDRLEVVFKGNVIKTATTPDTHGKMVLDFENEILESGWSAARAFKVLGQTIRFAHTSPIYVER